MLIKDKKVRLKTKKNWWEFNKGWGKMQNAEIFHCHWHSNVCNLLVEYPIHENWCCCDDSRTRTLNSENDIVNSLVFLSSNI